MQRCLNQRGWASAQGQRLPLRPQPLASSAARHCPSRTLALVRQCSCQVVAVQPQPPVAEPQASNEVPESAPAPPSQAPTLLSKLVKAHAARISEVLVLRDSHDGKLICSSGLDKSLATWALSLAPPPSPGSESDSGSPSTSASQHQITGTRLAAPGGPVFSLVRQPSPNPNNPVFENASDVIYCGNAAKEVVAWGIKANTVGSEEGDASFQTVATEYTGWVRAMSLMGKWLFSCGCNILVQHDTSFPIPKEVSKLELFKGDIQAIITHQDCVYVAASDGALRAFKVAKTGALQMVGEVLDAHNGRISSLTVHGNTLYSAGFDGWVRGWNADTLAPTAAVPAAHGGEKVHAMALGSDGLLYTGGDDKMIRSWVPLSPALDFLAALEPVADTPAPPPAPQPAADHCEETAAHHSSNGTNGNGHSSNGAANGVSVRAPAPTLPTLPPAGEPLQAHEANVRVLAAGSTECLVSGDSDGTLCIWALPSRPGPGNGSRRTSR